MREKSDPMLPYHCYGLDQFRYEYEALARVDPDGCWYKRDEVDAELAALRKHRDALNKGWAECTHAKAVLGMELETLRTRVAELEAALAMALEQVPNHEGLQRAFELHFKKPTEDKTPA